MQHLSHKKNKKMEDIFHKDGSYLTKNVSQKCLEIKKEEKN